jgi:hypothetical protein
LLLPARFATAIAATTTTARTVPAAATAAEAVPATTTITTAAGTWLAGFGLIHSESTAANVSAVQRFDGFIRLCRIHHLYERETTRLACIAVLHNLNPVNLSVGRKRGVEILLGRLERNVPDINILQGVLLTMLPAKNNRRQVNFKPELISAGPSP